MINFRKTEFVTSFGFAEQLAESKDREIVFCGRSNVGKSSLINKLCGQNKLARVSSSPGKTTTINFYRTTEDLILVDLPGYGYAKRSKDDFFRWSELMERYFSSGRNIIHALVLLDSRHEPTDDDLQMIEYMNRFSIPYWAVLTKTDKLNKTEYAEQSELFKAVLEPLGCAKIIPFSIKNEKDAEALRNDLSDLVNS
jgi:GTP-binding protein